MKENLMEIYTAFKSSNIQKFMYDKQKYELIVQFIGGTKYKYYDISNDQWKLLKLSKSKGKHFMQNIRASKKAQIISEKKRFKK